MKYGLIFLTLMSIKVLAQPGKEAWHWEFGNQKAMDFSTGTPVGGTCAINVYEGSASISDVNTGQLLFYTSGDNVWDRNNQRMPNGWGLIGGHGTTTQSSVIIPKPGNSHLYYVFTVDCGGYCGPSAGIFYSLVDMNLNGGLGDVVASQKNIPLLPPPTSEKILSISDCNGMGYWVITHPLDSNAFNSYHITSAGLNTQPVTSHVGTVQDNANSIHANQGYLKSAPDGKKLALVHSFAILELFDFDPASGIVSNSMVLDTAMLSRYSLSFSPDGSKLYTLEGIGDLCQYDLSSGTLSTIIASKQYLAYGTNIGAMQIGPDGKIYASISDATSNMSVINNPNALGMASNCTCYGSIPGSGCIGLPNFIDASHFTKLDLHDLVKCSGFSGDTLKADPNFMNYSWSTGATSSYIIINSPGTYWVNAMSSNGCLVSDTMKAYVPGAIDILKDTLLCSASGYTAVATFNGAQGYQWYDGSSNPEKQINSSGIYWVDIFFEGGCSVRDSFVLVLKNRPVVNLGKDTVYCWLPQPLVLDAGNAPGNTYQWSTGATTSTISTNVTGIYSVSVTGSNGCISTDSIQLYVLTLYQLNLPATQVFVCPPDTFPYLLKPEVPIESSTMYYWNGLGNNSQYPVFYANGPGKYWVRIDLKTSGGSTSCIIVDTFLVVAGCDTLNDIHSFNRRAFVRNFPNPFMQTTHIVVNLLHNEKIEFRVTDLLGNTFYFTRRDGVYGENTFVFDGSSLDAGVYYYTVTINGCRESGKMILQK